MKKYKVGKLANEMGVSSDLLKLYENYGVLTPQRDPDSQYRYYDIYHGGKLVSCLTLRNMGFTIRQTAALLESADPKVLDEALALRRSALEEERARLDRLIPAVEEYAALYAGFDRPETEGDTLVRPGYWFLAQTSTEEFHQTAGQKKLARRLLDELPYSERLLVVDSESLAPGVPLRFQWGLALREDRAAGWPTGEMRRLPPCLCRRYYQTASGGAVNKEDFFPGLEHLAAEGYTLSGDLVCQVPVGTSRDGAMRACRVAWLPIAEG